MVTNDLCHYCVCESSFRNVVHFIAEWKPHKFVPGCCSNYEACVGFIRHVDTRHYLFYQGPSHSEMAYLLIYITVHGLLDKLVKITLPFRHTLYIAIFCTTVQSPKGWWLYTTDCKLQLMLELVDDVMLVTMYIIMDMIYIRSLMVWMDYLLMICSVFIKLQGVLQDQMIINSISTLATWIVGNTFSQFICITEHKSKLDIFWRFDYV